MTETLPELPLVVSGGTAHPGWRARLLRLVVRPTPQPPPPPEDPGVAGTARDPVVVSGGTPHPGWRAQYVPIVLAGVLESGGWVGVVGGELPTLAGSLRGSTTGQVGGEFPPFAGRLVDQPIHYGVLDGLLPGLTGGLVNTAPEVATQYPGTDGEAPTLVPALLPALSSGNKVEHGTRLLIVNDGEGSVVLTIATPYADGGLALGDGAVTIPAGSWPANARLVDVPFGLYAQPGDGLCHLDWSTTVGISFAVLGRHAV